MNKIQEHVLQQLYLEQQKTTREIAAILEVASSTVVYNLKKFKIPTRKAGPRRGFKHSSLTKQRLSAAAKLRFSDKKNHPWYGKKHSEESRSKMSRSGRGINKRAHLPEWDGSRTPLHTKFINSVYWKKTREEVFQRDNFTCQLSGIRGGDLECHHIIPKHKIDHNEWLDKENLITLSKAAHRLTKGKEHLFERGLKKILETS
jgi:hypothetical protein